VKGDWDHNMDAHHLLRGLQNRSDPNNQPSPAHGTVAILIVLLALFCFLWYDSSLGRLYSFRLSICSMMILTNNVNTLLTNYQGTSKSATMRSISSSIQQQQQQHWRRAPQQPGKWWRLESSRSGNCLGRELPSKHDG
jgi:hypothetical protein